MGPTYAILLLLAGLAAAEWEVVSTVTDGAAPPGVRVTTCGTPQQPFARPLPQTLDPQLLPDFLASLNVLQDLTLEGNNTFTLTSEQYVASIPNAFVQGEAGTIFDSSSRLYLLPNMHFNRTTPLPPVPSMSPAEAGQACERHAKLASVVQRYGHMYFHFLEEALPRVALLLQSGLLTPDTQLLTWGSPYEYEYLALMGIPASQVLPFDALKTYCAQELLVPTPTPRITPPREALQAVRTALGVQTLPPEQRQLVVYVSREGQDSRSVSNEAQLLQQIRAAFPLDQVVVFSGDLPAADTIALFQQAKVILGPHGAGLSNALFAAPGTTLIEFLFLEQPPLMFWHTAAALGQPYWLLPVAQGHYMQAEFEVPAGEVLDVLTAVLAPSASGCPPGSHTLAGGACEACRPGSYAYNRGSPSCKPCPPGQAAALPGSVACRTAQPGSYASADGTAFLACPAGTHSLLPGAWDVSQCLDAQQRRQALEQQALDPVLFSKLSPTFARVLQQRRQLIQQQQGASASPAGSSNSTAAPLSAHDMCVAQSMVGGLEAYSGPYRLAELNCPPPPQPAVPLPLAPAPAPALAVMLPSPDSGVPMVGKFDGPPDDGSSGSLLPPVNVQTLPWVNTQAQQQQELSTTLLTPDALQAQQQQQQLAQAPAPAGEQPGAEGSVKPKKMLDTFVIAILGVLAGLVLVPCTCCCVGHCLRRRQQLKARQSRPLLGGMREGHGYNNALFTGAPPASSTGGDGADVSAGSSHALEDGSGGESAYASGALTHSKALPRETAAEAAIRESLI